MSKYKLIRLTNSNIGALPAQSILPLGSVTRRVNIVGNNCPGLKVGLSSADTLSIYEPGYYKITYNGTFTAAAIGTMSISLVNNGTTVFTVSDEAAAAEDSVDLTLIYVIRVYPNCCGAVPNSPANLQIQLGDTAIGITPTPSSANLIVERVY
jgi:hypothetical protein